MTLPLAFLSQWTELSFARPSESNFPIILGSFDGGGHWVEEYFPSPIDFNRRPGKMTNCFWHSVLRVMPPARNPTQDELDSALVDRALAAYQRDGSLLGERAMIRTGINYERSEIRRLIERHRNGELPAPELIRIISGRVKL